MYRYKIFIVLLCLVFSGHAQEKLILKGKITDIETDEVLIGASITVEPVQKGTSTNAEGKFKINLATGAYQIKATYVGYKTSVKNIVLSSDTLIILNLRKKNLEVGEVTVEAKNKDSNIKSGDVGVSSLSAKDIDKLPGLMGKPDVINALRQTPGVQGAGEGNAGIYVRGGDAGQNLILLDNMPLYNPSHLLGFFPVFNADIIREAKITKGGIPANYGGKAASVIDIKMKDGNQENSRISGSVGLLSTDLTLSSPINKGKGGLIISGRRTYFEALKEISKPMIKKEDSFFNNTNYYFYDASVKFNYRIAKNSRIYLNSYHSLDNYKLTDKDFDISNNMTWSNSAAALRFNHVVNNVITDISVGYTRYYFDMNSKLTKYAFTLFSEIQDIYSNVDVTWLALNNKKIKTGVSFTKHKLTPNKIDIDVEEIAFNNTNRFYSDEFSAYIMGEAKIKKQLSGKAGIRYTVYRHIGPYTHYKRDETGQINDSVLYPANESIKNYHTLNPYLSWVYLLNSQSSVKGSASYTHQFIHLASVGTVSLPTDVWLPSTSFIQPQKVGIISCGYYRNFFDNIIESSVDIYYKRLGNQIDFLNGVLDNFDNTKIEDNIISGFGNSYGIEFFIKKQLGNTKGSISYTLSRTTRNFDQINNGRPFPAKYDRTHDLSVNAYHKLNNKWVLSAAFVFATGNAMTLPQGRYIIQGNIANDYTRVNAYRMPSYHRLDISAKYILAEKKRWKSSLVFSIYNVYNHSNPYYIYFRVKGDLDNYYLNVQPRQISLFPILPSITWNFEF